MRRALPLAVVFVSACAAAPPVADKPSSVPLVGTWRLLNIVAVRSNGEHVASRFGESPTGYIHYDGTGHMAVQIMANPWPRFANPDKPTPQELEAVFNRYVAYAGTYDFDAVERAVTHHVQMSVDPDDVGQDFRRTVEIEGDRVTLSVAHYPLNGEQVVLRLQWQRVQ